MNAILKLTDTVYTNPLHLYILFFSRILTSIYEGGLSLFSKFFFMDNIYADAVIKMIKVFLNFITVIIVLGVIVS